MNITRLASHGLKLNIKSASDFSKISIRRIAAWRKMRNLEPNPNTFGTLTNSPDYSFVDGRPAPLGKNLLRRMDRQKQYCERIVQLSGELDFARERYAEKQREEQERRKSILQSKLKPKGAQFHKTMNATSKTVNDT